MQELSPSPPTSPSPRKHGRKQAVAGPSARVAARTVSRVDSRGSVAERRGTARQRARGGNRGIGRPGELDAACSPKCKGLQTGRHFPAASGSRRVCERPSGEKARPAAPVVQRKRRRFMRGDMGSGLRVVCLDCFITGPAAGACISLSRASGLRKRRADSRRCG